MGPMGPAPGWGSVRGGAEEEPSLAPLYQARAQHRALFAAVTSPGRSNGESWDRTPNHTVLGEFRHFSPLLDAGLGREGAGGAAPQLCPLTCPSPVLFPDNLHGQGRKGRCWAVALWGGAPTVGPPCAHSGRHPCGLQRTAPAAQHARFRLGAAGCDGHWQPNPTPRHSLPFPAPFRSQCCAWRG